MLFTAGLAPAVTAAPGQTVKSVADGTPVDDLVKTLIGDETVYSDVTITGSDSAIGVFDGFTTLGTKAGVVLSTGNVNNRPDSTGKQTPDSPVPGPNNTPRTSGWMNTPGDPNIDALLAQINPGATLPICDKDHGNTSPSCDAIALEFDFVPLTSKLRFDYIFASEEYNSYVGTTWNDAFGLYINNTNCALVGPAGSQVPVSINTINNGSNPQVVPPLPPQNETLYRDNTDKNAPVADTGFNGLTTVLSCNVDVNKGVKNHAKFVIADVADRNMDAGVFIPAGSFTTGDNGIHGHLYNDLMRDGQVTGDPGLANQTVGLYDSSYKLLQIKTTDIDGKYNFDNVPGGGLATYYVRPVQVTVPSGVTTVPATQTYGQGYTNTDHGITNKAEVQCATTTRVATGGPCDPVTITGTEPPIGAIGSTSNKSEWPSYATVTVYGDATVAADFGYAGTVDANKSTLKVQPASQTVNKNITATVEAKDASGNPLPGVNVSFTKVSPEINLSGTTCTTTAPSGACDITLTSAVPKNYPNELSATVVINGSNVPVKDSPASVTFNKGPVDPKESSFTVAPEAVVTATTNWVEVGPPTGPNHYVGTFTAKDEYKNPLDGLDTNAITTAMHFNVNSTDVVISAITPVGGGTGQYTVYYTSTKANKVGGAIPMASLKYEGDDIKSPAGATLLPVPFKPGPPVSKNTKLSVDNTTPVVGDTVTATTRVADEYDNPIPGITVNYAVSPSAPAVLTPKSVTTDENGNAVATLTDTKLETVSLSSVLPNEPGVQVQNSPVDITFGKTIISPKDSDFEVYITDPAATFVAADGVQSWTGKLTARDEFKNLLPDETISRSSFGVVPAGVTVSDVTNNHDGTYTVTYTSTKAGTYTASLVIGGEQVGKNEPITFGPGIPCAACSTVTVAPPTQMVGSLVTATITVKDANYNLIPGLTAADIQIAGKSAGKPDMTWQGFQETAPGVYTFDGTSTKVGEFEVSVVASGVPLDQKPHVTFTPGDVCVVNCVDPESRTRFEMIQNDQLADGIAQDKAKAYAFDTYGNVVPNATVVVTDQTTGPLTGKLTPHTATATTGTDGTAIVSWTSTVAGVYTAEGTMNGLKPPATGVLNNIRFTNGAVDPSKSDMVITPASPIVVGNQYTVTVTARDKTGNLVKDASISFYLDPANPAELSEDSCQTGADGTCKVYVTSKLVTNVAVHATVPDNTGKPTDLGGNGNPAKASPQTVGFGPDEVCVVNCTPVDPTHITRVEVTKDGVKADGKQTDEAVAYAYDRFGNAVPGKTVASTPKDAQMQVSGTIPKTGADGTSLIKYSSTVASAHVADVTIDGKVPAQAISMGNVRTTNGTITLHFGSGDGSPANSWLTISPTTAQQVGSSFVVTAHIADVNDNPVAGAMVVFPSVPNLTFNMSSCESVMNAAGTDATCPVTVTSTKTGTYDISATLNGAPLRNTVKAQFTPGPVCVTGPGCLTRVEVTQNGMKPDGKDRDIAKVYAYDQYGNPVPDQVVTSTQASGTPDLTIQPAIAPTGADGTTTIWYTATRAGVYKADVTVATLTPSGSPVSLVFGSGIGDPDHSEFVVTPAGPLVVGEDPANTYTAKATVRDAMDVPVADAAVTFRVNPNGPVFNNNEETCTTNTAGVCEVKIHSTKAGTYGIQADLVNGHVPVAGTSPKEYAVAVAWKADAVCSQLEGCDPVDPTTPPELRTRVEVIVNNQVANGSDQDVAKVWAFDKWANPVVGGLVKSEKVVATDNLRIQTGISAIGNDGSSTIWYTSTKAGAHQASVTVDGFRPVGTPITLNFVPGPVCVVEAGCDPEEEGTKPENQTRVEITVNDAQTGQPNTVKAYAFDKFGNAKPDAVFDIVTVDPALLLGPAGTQTAKITTGPDGTGTLNATSNTGGHHLATASVNGTELINHGSPLDLKWLAKPVITSPAPGYVTTARPEIKGTGSVPGYNMTVTDGTDVVCTATVQPDKSWSCTPNKDLNQGPHTLVATEDNKGGKVSQPSDPVQINVDSIKPKAPVITDPVNDKPVKENKPVIKGTGDEPGNKIIVRDGDDPICEATVAPDKTWQCTSTKELPDGEHPIHANEVDPAGNVSDPSNVVKVVIDTKAPDAPVVNPSNGSEFNGTAEPESKVTIWDDKGQPIPGCIDVPVSVDGKWSCTPNTKVPGGKEVTATAKDEAGNVSPPTKVTILELGIKVAYTTRNPLEEQVVTGTNFNKGEKVTLTFDTPGFAPIVATADDNGNVTIKFTVPADAAVGTHSVTLTGTKSGSVSATFQVTAPPKPAVITGGDNANHGALGMEGIALTLLIGAAATLVAVRVRSRRA